MSYISKAAVKPTPQSEALDDRQVQNSAGGFTYKIEPTTLLERFLMLGSESGSYYATAQKLTKHNANNVINIVKRDGINAINLAEKFWNENRAPRSEPVFFVLACAFIYGDAVTKQYAKTKVPTMIRTGGQLLDFVATTIELKGGGMGQCFKKAVAEWYNSRKSEEVLFQIQKYRRRGSWTHYKVLGMVRTKPKTKVHSEVYGYVRGKNKLTKKNFARGVAIDNLKNLNAKDTIAEIAKHNLTWQHTTTEARQHDEVWEALYKTFPMGALVRNIVALSRHNVIKPLDQNTQLLVDKFNNAEAVKKSRLHPLDFMIATKAYAKSGNEDNKVFDALDSAFNLAFSNVEATGKRLYIGLDCSSSMNSEAFKGLSAFELAAAFALAFVRTENNYVVRGFNNKMQPINMSAKDTLNSTLDKMKDVHWGGTDCALPMLDAMESNLDVDTFVIFTDNETWCGDIHPMEALKKYRQKSGIKDAKLVVCAFTSTDFTIADPDDVNTLDVVGVDSHLPKVIQEFIIK